MKTQFENISQIAPRLFFLNDGNSEGAKKGWETRRGEFPVTKENIHDVAHKLRKKYPGIVLDVQEEGDKVFLNLIRLPVKMQGMGIGTKAINEFKKYADANRMKINLVPQAPPTPGARDWQNNPHKPGPPPLHTEEREQATKKLIKWYRSLGFHGDSFNGMSYGKGFASNRRSG